MTPDDFTHLLDQGGTLALLAIALVAFWRGWIVPGRDFDRMVVERDRAIQDRDRWQEAAFRSLQLGERVTSHIEKGAES